MTALTVQGVAISAEQRDAGLAAMVGRIMPTRGGKTLAYNEKGDFVASRRMREELQAAGFSIGSGQRGSPTGVLHGHYLIAKWRNLSREERSDLHGVVEGDSRHGPLLVTIFDDAPRAARDAISRLFMDRLRDAYSRGDA